MEVSEQTCGVSSCWWRSCSEPSPCCREGDALRCSPGAGAAGVEELVSTDVMGGLDRVEKLDGCPSAITTRLVSSFTCPDLFLSRAACWHRAAQPLPAPGSPGLLLLFVIFPSSPDFRSSVCSRIFKKSFKNSQFVSIRMNQLVLPETSNKSTSYIIC